MTFRRSLLATALVAATLAPAPAAFASCHWCGLGLTCDSTCAAVLTDVFEAVESTPASHATDRGHTLCHSIDICHD